MEVLPLPNSHFGAVVTNASLENLQPDALDTIRDALYKHQVLLFKDQQHLSPKAQYELTKLFDPSSEVYGHGNVPVSKQAKSVLHPDLKTIPHQPQGMLTRQAISELEY